MIAALHPVNALLIFALSVLMIRRATNCPRRASLGEIDRPTREPDNYLIGP